MTPLERIVRRYARTHGPFTTRELRAATASTWARSSARWSASSALVRGELRPGGSEREWCDPEVLRRIRRASLATLREEVEPADKRALARLLPAWQGVDVAPAGRRRPRPAARDARAAPGPRARARGLGARRAAAPRRARTRPPGSTSSAPPASSSGSAPARLGRRSGKVALYFRDDGRLDRSAEREARAPRRAASRRAARAPRARGLLLERPDRRRRPRRRSRGRRRRAAGGALGPRLGGRGHQRRVRAAARAAARSSPATRATARGASAGRRRRHSPADPGPLVAHRAAVRERAGFRAADARARRAAARALRDRHARDRTRRGRRRRLLGALRRAREPRDAWHAPAAATSSRVSAAPSSPCRPPIERLRAAARGRASRGARARGDRPRQPLRGRAAVAATRGDGGRRPARVAGAFVVMLDAEPVLYLERSGRGLVAAARAARRRRRDRSPGSPTALAALADHVRRGRIGRIALERFDGEPVVGSLVRAAADRRGFRQGPRRLTLSRL